MTTAVATYPLESVCRSGRWITRSPSAPGVWAEGTTQREAEERLVMLLMLREIAQRELAPRVDARGGGFVRLVDGDPPEECG